jgi:hypothetical protein
MTVYYFHVQAGARLIVDPSGIDLAGPADALEAAARLAADLLDDNLPGDWAWGAIRVEDEQRRRILRVPMASVRARAERRKRPHTSGHWK